jgi:hypothetical protein
MTLKDAMTADLPVFTNSDEFGVQAVFSGSGKTIDILLDKQVEEETGLLVDVVTVSLSAVAGIEVNDTFVTGGKTYFNQTTEPVSVDGLMATFRVNT